MIDADLTNDVARRAITNRYITDFDLDHDFLSVRRGCKRLANSQPTRSATTSSIHSLEKRTNLERLKALGSKAAASESGPR